jgi:preprotein translocase subunit Sec63
VFFIKTNTRKKQVQGDSKIASFDPYALLSIDRSATDRQIKKAYKLKALEFHPDKNVGDERAAQMFMMIAKAYEALTDEAAKANWEKYGNPDGKQSFEMSIGLPTFLMEKNNHNLILLAYLVLMVVIIPTIVWAYYRQSQMYGEGNIMYRTYQTYANLLLRADRPPITKVYTYIAPTHSCIHMSSFPLSLFFLFLEFYLCAFFFLSKLYMCVFDV